jgi:hypothetical protein
VPTANEVLTLTFTGDITLNVPASHSTRSAGANRGRLICRPSTATSCRKTSSSTVRRAQGRKHLSDAGEEVLHVFLEADAGVLRGRLNSRVADPGREWDQAAHKFGMTGVNEMVAAAAGQPAAI